MSRFALLIYIYIYRERERERERERAISTGTILGANIVTQDMT